MQVLLDNETTQISFIDMNTEIVFVCFNSLGLETPDKLDFYSLSKKFSTIFIIDKTNSWGNNLDWAKISEIVNNKIEDKIAYSIGVSMGGTNSILSANYLNTKYVVAFNPQFSIHPDIIPESHYRPYAEKIKNWVHFSIDTSLKIKTKTYYLFVSSHDVADTVFLHRYPEYVFNFGHNYGHNLAFDLKNAGHLARILDAIPLGNIEIQKALEAALQLDKEKDML